MEAEMTTCPIQLEINLAEDTGAEFIKAVRRLRRAMVLCDRCQSVDGCPIREQFYQKMDSVVARVVNEWEMAGGA
jgi:hypothetical protein